MRLLRQFSLTYSRPGSSKIKVYEIDLCEVGSDKYVVNYRYGRRGRPLHDGTRTISPISLGAAVREFDALLTEKQQSGYVIVDRYERDLPGKATPPAPPPKAAPSTTVSPPQHTAPIAISSSRQHALNPVWSGPQGEPPAPDDDDEEIVLTWLAHHCGEAVSVQGTWPLARVAWRAGELGLSEATPRLIALLGRSHGEDYAIAWALGRCGGASVADTLSGLLGHDSPSVARIARSGLILVASDSVRAAQEERLRAGLPAALQDGVSQASLESVELERDAVAALYLLGHGDVLRAWLSTVSLATTEPLAHARTILQLAEHHDDIVTVASVTARLEGAVLGTTASGARRLRSRGWRLLRQLHEDDAPLARELAMGLLQAFSDKEHPQANDPQRRLYRELEGALAVLGDVSDDELLALVGAPCSRVSTLALAQAEERLLSTLSLPLLGALFAKGGAAGALGTLTLSTVDGDLFRSWAVEQTEVLAGFPALMGTAAVHWDGRVRAEARLLLGQLAPGAAVDEALAALLRACAGPDLPAEAAFDGVETAWQVFSAALHKQPTDALVALMRPSAHPLNGMASTLLVERGDVPLGAAVPALCEGGEAGVLVGLAALEGASDEALTALEALDQRLLVQRLKLLYSGPQAPLRSRVLLQLARLLLLSGRLDEVIASQNADQVS